MDPKVVIALTLLHCSAESATQLEDFPACGYRNECNCGLRDECLWDCTWVANPFHRAHWTVNLVDGDLKDPENPDENVVFENVNYFMTTPKIPKDLSCLDGCRLREIVSCIR